MSQEENIQHLEQDIISADNVQTKLALLTDLFRIPEYTYTQRAFDLAQHCLSLAESVDDIYSIAQSKFYIGVYFTQHSEHTLALPHLLHSCTVFTDLKDEMMRARVMHLLAVIYSKTKEGPKAIAMFLENLDVFERYNHPQWIAQTLTCMGATQESVGDLIAALTTYLRALQLWEHQKDTLQIGICYNNISAVYGAMGDYEKAISYALATLESHRKIGYRSGEALALSNIGGLYTKCERYDEAFSSLQQAIALFRTLGLDNSEANSRIIMGVIYEHYGDTMAALQSYEHALSIGIHTGRKRIIGDAYINIGSIYRKIRNREEAIISTNKALAVARELNDLPLQSDALKALTEFYEETGALDRAFECYKLYHEIREKVFGYEKQRAVLQLQMRLEVERSEKEKELYRIKSEKLELEMKHKASELTSAALHLVQKSEFLEQIREQIIKILHSSKPGKASLLRNLLQQVQHNIHTDEEWKIFKEQFEQVHYDFIHLLLQQYPMLTPAELKICALLKMSLSTKEISRLLCLSSRTIDYHRYHIRKKLILDQDTNLASFLSSL